MKAHLVVFDLDGTLVDSRIDIAVAVNRVLVDLDRQPLPLDDIVGFVGHGVTRLLERALADPALVEAGRPLFEKHYGGGLLVHTRPFPGVDSLLRELSVGCALGVATNKPGVWAREIVAGLGWSEVITSVVGAGDVARLKPAPDMFDLLLERTGCSRSGAVIVGDMEVDVELARAARAPFIGVTWGLAGHERLGTAGAGITVDTTAELATLLESFPI